MTSRTSVVLPKTEFGSPFAARPGRELKWSNIQYSIVNKKGTKKILNNVSGILPASSTACILGPSGAGKSSLLNTLGGRILAKGDNKLSGSIELNNKHMKFSKMKRQTAYVMQDDALMATLTPRECLRFSAALRIPNSVTKSQKEALVNQMILELGLSTCADTLVGNELIKGISGGEKKRTSVGVELVTNPSLVFLDEPTSGLDSFSAYQCVDMLRKIAAAGSSVLCTIHQPSSEVFAMFDYCVIMKDGWLVYHGPAAEVGAHFTRCGYALPENYNPADHVLSVVQINSIEQLRESKVVLELTADAIDQVNTRHLESSESSSQLINVDLETVGKAQYAVGFPTQLSWLMWREFVNIRRDIGGLVGRFGITAFLAILYGIIFHGAGDRDDKLAQNFGTHFGILTFLSIEGMFGTAQATLIAFPFQRPIFIREYASGTYRSPAYFISKALSEVILAFFQNLILVLVVYFMTGLNGNFILMVIVLWMLGLASSGIALVVGSAADNVTVAMESAPGLFVPQILFAGFFIRLEQVPVFLRWAQYLCSLKYAVNLMVLIEFESCVDEIDTPCGELLLDNNIKREHWWVYGLILLALFVGLRVLSLIILRKRAQKL